MSEQKEQPHRTRKIVQNDVTDVTLHLVRVRVTLTGFRCI